MGNILEYKSIHASTKDAIKDIDETKGIVSGYFSVFGNKDSDSDIIMPGAYTKTLNENYRRIKHLYQHNPWQPLSGTKNDNLVVTQDNYGLHFVSTVSKTSWGRDAIRLYADGVIDEQSVGFQTIKSQDRQGYRELTELKLWEGSAVTWAANEQALTGDVKSLDKDLLFTKMNNVVKSIRNGKYENEDIFDSLELYVKQIQLLIHNLTKQATEPLPSTLPDDVKGIFTTFKETLKAK